MLIKPATPKKDHALKQLPSKLSFHIEDYYDCFQTETSNNLDLGQAYIQGLFKTEAGKRNMERLNEELDLSGNGYQRIVMLAILSMNQRISRKENIRSVWRVSMPA